MQGRGFELRVQDSGFRVQGIGFQGSGYRVQISRFTVQRFGFKDLDSAVRVRSLEVRVHGVGFKVVGSCRNLFSRTASAAGTKTGTGTPYHPMVPPTVGSYALPGSAALPGLSG